MDRSPQGSSIHGILQPRILEWVAMPSPRGSSPPGIEPGSPTLQADSFPSEPLVQFSSVTQSRLILCNPLDCSMPGFPVHHHLLELAQTHVHQVVMTSNHLILCRPLLFPSSIFPSIRVFSNESALCIRWPNYWEFQLQHQSFQ